MYIKRVIGKHFLIANRTSIEERQEIVNMKTRFGDWEMDTIIGANQKEAILTLTERMISFVFIEKLDLGKNAEGLKKSNHKPFASLQRFCSHKATS